MRDEPKVRVSARGLSCPLPIYKLKKALDQVDIGETVLLETDDPAVIKEIRALARRINLDLKHEAGRDGVVLLYVKRNPLPGF